jgi:hypothetical protein
MVMISDPSLETRRVPKPRKRWRGAQYEDEFPTLGWAILDWTAEHLPSPADESKSLVFTDEQARLFLRWYQIDPEHGRFVFRRLILETAKGWGKSPWAAVDALAQLTGPVCFDGWDANGDPVGVPWGTGDRPAAWVQIAAVSEDQTENTYGALYSMLVANEFQAAKTLRIDQGRTRLYLTGRPGRLEPVTASAGSREGQRTTHGVLDETWLWTPRNGGVRLAGTLRRNVAKMGGRTVETTNAPMLGDKSVAETSGVDADAGSPGILRFAPRPKVEPDPDWPDERLREALDAAYGDAYWVDRGRRLLEIKDPASPWDEALRFWFNVRTTGAGRAIDPRQWDDLTRPQDVPAGTIIGVGFDGSISRDATVIRGCTQAGYRFLIRAWVRPRGAEMQRWLAEYPDEREWTVNRQEVNDEIARIFATWRVGLFLGDPPKWWDELEDWRRLYGPRRGERRDGHELKQTILNFDTFVPTRMAPAVDRWRTAIREGATTHDDDPLTAEHVKHAQLRKVHLQHDADDQRTKYVLVKGDDGFGLDAAIADVLCYEAAMTMDEPPKPVDRTVRAL